MAKPKQHRFFRVTLGGWGFLTLCILLAMGAINASINLVYLLASLLLSIFSMSLIGPFWSTHGLNYQRAKKVKVHAGEPFQMDAWVSSTRRTSTRLVTIEESLESGVDSESLPGRHLLMIIPPRGRARVHLALTPRKRGVYPLPPLKMSSRFPFGIAESGFTRSEQSELVVFPARGRLRAPLTSMLDPRGWQEGVVSRWGGHECDFRSIREYRPGDSLRSIHWRASAHRGRLIIREHDRERSAPFTIVLDSRIPASTPSDERKAGAEALELAISFTAEACRVALSHGNSVRLIGFFPERRMLSAGANIAEPPGFSEHPCLSGILDALARAKPSEAEDASELAGALSSSSVYESVTIVVVTPTARSAGGLKMSLGHLNMRLYVADDPSFARVFSLLKPQKEPVS